MGTLQYIKNYDKLAFNEDRKLILELINTAIASIQPDEVLKNNFVLDGNNLIIQNKEINLLKNKRIFLLGFGKGSSGIAAKIEGILGDKLTAGYVIDTTPQAFSKIQFTLGTHPLPSATNLEFTNNVLSQLKDLQADDLIIVVTCGGGSAMLESTRKLTLEQLTTLNKGLLHAGANIYDMNIIRKHVSRVKGGGLAQLFFPATIFNLVFSDVPGDDLSIIASGPFVKDKSSAVQAWEVFQKFNLGQIIPLQQSDFEESPKDDKYFEKVTNVLMVSNMTALKQMEAKAKEYGKTVKIYSNKFQSVANQAGKFLIEQTSPNSILLAGGETTVKVEGTGGEGGRNQEVVLAALSAIDANIIIVSFDSDGWDNSPIAGAIGDIHTVNKMKELNIDPSEFLTQHNSSAFFKSVGDAILTGRLSSNVSDLMIIYKK